MQIMIEQAMNGFILTVADHKAGTSDLILFNSIEEVAHFLTKNYQTGVTEVDG